MEKIGADVIWGENFVEISRPAERKIQAFDLDANHIPDAAMTLAIVALATKQPCTLRNIGSWRVKETDRITAMATELRKLGAEVVEEAEAIHITPPETLTPMPSSILTTTTAWPCVSRWLRFWASRHHPRPEMYA